MKSMEPSELVKQPQDVTENPYRLAAKDKDGRPKRTNLDSSGSAAMAAAEDEVRMSTAAWCWCWEL